MNLSLLAVVPILATTPAVPHPVSLGIYTRCVTSKYGKNCDPTLQLAKGGTRVNALTAFPTCSPVPLRKAPSAKISRARFRFDGTVKNVLGKRVKVAISGHVLTRKTIRVSYRMTTSTCHAKTRTVTLSFTKVGRPGEVG